MKKNQTIINAGKYAIVAGLIFAGLIQPSSAQTAADPDFGTWTGTKYVNSKLGLNLEVPAEWIIYEGHTILEKIKEEENADKDEIKDELDKKYEDLVKSSSILFLSSKKSIESPDILNENMVIQCMIISTRNTLGIKTAKDYIVALTDYYKAGEESDTVSLKQKSWSEIISGKSYEVIEAVMFTNKKETSEITFISRYYCTMIDNKIVSFSLFSGDQKSMTELKNMFFEKLHFNTEKTKEDIKK